MGQNAKVNSAHMTPAKRRLAARLPVGPQECRRIVPPPPALNLGGRCENNLNAPYPSSMVRTFFLWIALAAFSGLTWAQVASLTEAQDLPEGIHTFDFGNGNFDAYIDSEGWMLWAQYHHLGGTNPGLNVIQPGNNLPIYDSCPLGCDLSWNPAKWGHGSQSFAASIPDGELWLRWEATTSNHDRKIHFESPVLGRFLSNEGGAFTPEISYMNVLRDDHTAFLPASAGATSMNVNADYVLTNGPFWNFNQQDWQIRGGGRWNVDDVRNDDEDETLILSEHSTLHRIWVKPVPFNGDLLMAAMCDFQDHINGTQSLSEPALTQIKNTVNIYADELPQNEALMVKALAVISDYDAQVGPLFTTPNTSNGFSKDPESAPGMERERVMVALQQAVFDHVFTPEVYAQYPGLVAGTVFNSCVNFPGQIAPPADASVTQTVSIRANFADPEGINPYFNINGDGTEHALRPTGTYLAPGSVATITVPSSLVGGDFHVRVGSHEWDLTNKPLYKRLDRITKKFALDATTIAVYNPLGGAISILVPYGADAGIIDVTITNAVEAPFFSLKSFDETADFEAELDKPGPWAVFETDNVMWTIPKHSIVPGQYDLMQAMLDWDTALQAINTIMGRELVSDKHNLYLIADVLIRGGAYSIGYPMSNTPLNYTQVPGSVYFIDGPGSNDEVTFHEYGHALNMSKFSGETEALVNFPYIMAMNYGLGQDLNEAVMYSFVPNTFNIDRSATHRLVSNSFGSERDITNSTTNEVRYQHRGYAHYFEIVDLLDWCPLQAFWESEYADFLDGIEYGENDDDSRMLRMSIAAGEDLRPLFHVFGILPDNEAAVNAAFDAEGLVPSLSVYNRLQEYADLIPVDQDAFVQYALTVYPNMWSEGPSANPDYGTGWHYQKSLTYTATEAAERNALLADIIALYYPLGSPLPNPNPCALTSDCPPDFDDNGTVSVNDVLVALGDFGCIGSCTADLNGDGLVGVADILLVLAQFGQPCG